MSLAPRVAPAAAGPSALPTLAALRERSVPIVMLTADDHTEQRMHREALVRGEEVERGRRTHVSDDGSRLDDGARRGDLAVGDADQDDRGARARLAAPDRSMHIGSGRTQCGGERGSHAAAADDGDRSHAGNLPSHRNGEGVRPRFGSDP